MHERMAPSPERAVGPALFQCVVFAQRAAIGRKLTLKHQSVQFVKLTRAANAKRWPEQLGA
jgi:hypothetical protein